MEWDVRDNSNFEELNSLGARLSQEINCPVRSFPYDKGIFECACGIPFMLHLIKGERWDLVKKKHEEGR